MQTDHVVLFQVIEARKMEGVTAALRKHIESTCKRVFKGQGADREWDAGARGGRTGLRGRRCQNPAERVNLLPVAPRQDPK